MRGWAGSVTENSVFPTEISATRLKIFPYEHSIPDTSEVCDLYLLVKSQESIKL